VSRPILFALDEDECLLRDVERELVDRYARSYQVVCVSAPEEAIEQLEALAAGQEDVALVLSAQWLDGTTGSELLGRVRALHPHAQRGLLIEWGSWGDGRTGEAIFQAMARIDHVSREGNRRDLPRVGVHEEPNPEPRC